MATPRQQRIDPRRITGGDDAAGTSTQAPKKGKAPQSGQAQKKGQTPKKGRPTPKRDVSTGRRAPVRDATSAAARTPASARAATKGPQREPERPRTPKTVGPLRRSTTPGDWIAGARPQTLALAIAPVALGTGVASLQLPIWTDHWVRALVCLGIAVALQIGVNFANDYSDGIRGTDADRVGPARLVGSGRARPRTVLVVAIVFFAIAALGGVFLTITTGYWWLLIVGAVAIAAAWFYTGGRRPYGYAALGELAVFVFFGLVATLGTVYVQAPRIELEAWLAAIAAGCLACAVLLVNNLRDRFRDAQAGKRTLSVLIGEVPSRILYAVLVLAPFGILAAFVVLYPLTAFVYFALVSALPAVVIVILARTSRELVTALKLSTLTALLFGLGLGAALAFG